MLTANQAVWTNSDIIYSWFWSHGTDIKGDKYTEHNQLTFYFYALATLLATCAIFDAYSDGGFKYIRHSFT